jgi:hypothetical protein
VVCPATSCVRCRSTIDWDARRVQSDGAWSRRRQGCAHHRADEAEGVVVALRMKLSERYASTRETLLGACALRRALSPHRKRRTELFSQLDRQLVRCPRSGTSSWG